MIEKLKRRATIATLVLLAALLPPAAAGDEETGSGGCVLQSIELDEQDRETLLRIRTDGEPASIGARVEPDQGVVLDLGCTPGSGLSGQEFAEGLVSALLLNHGSAEQGGPTALVIKIRGAFEYSVSTQPEIVLVSLRAKDGAAPEATPGVESQPKVRVLEPLPIAVVPQPPIPAPAPPSQPAASQPAASQPAAAPDISQVVTAVDDWARTWSDQRIEDYLSAYASDFQPPDGLSRPVWEARRRSRIAAPDWIEVVLDHGVTYLTGTGHAITSFRQRYSSSSFNDEVDKTLVLIQEDGRWRIQREATGRPGDLSAASPSLALPEPAATVSGGEPPAETPPAAPATTAALVEGARNSVLIAPAYDASYQFLTYPGGDPGWERGSGTDVVVRAYRHVGIDLQERVHQDILAAAAEYGVKTPDPHIDHRRTRNLMTFLRRHGSQLGLDLDADWRPGDIVFWAVDGRLTPDHQGIVSDRRSPDGRLLVVHHEKGLTPREDDVLFAWTVRGHYRWLPAD